MSIQAKSITREVYAKIVITGSVESRWQLRVPTETENSMLDMFAKDVICGFSTEAGLLIFLLTEYDSNLDDLGKFNRQRTRLMI